MDNKKCGVGNRYELAVVDPPDIYLLCTSMIKQYENHICLHFSTYTHEVFPKTHKKRSCLELCWHVVNTSF